MYKKIIGILLIVSMVSGEIKATQAKPMELNKLPTYFPCGRIKASFHHPKITGMLMSLRRYGMKWVDSITLSGLMCWTPQYNEISKVVMVLPYLKSGTVPSIERLKAIAGVPSFVPDAWITQANSTNEREKALPLNALRTATSWATQRMYTITNGWELAPVTTVSAISVNPGLGWLPPHVALAYEGVHSIDEDHIDCAIKKIADEFNATQKSKIAKQLAIK